MTRPGDLPGRLVLLGHPVAHSLSPRFQNAALRSARLPLVYEAVDVVPADLPNLLAELVAARAAGNVTIPHKRTVAACCAHLTALAARAGAVNTFWTEDGALVGDNTDVIGFHHAAAALLGREPAAERVALLGAGGAAAAVLSAIERWEGARAVVYNRTMPAAQSLVSGFAQVAVTAAAVDEAVAGATLVVNATSVGMSTDALPAPIALLSPGAAVLDLVYRPGSTRWVREARTAGHAAADGLTMVVEQGAAAFERWFGVPPDRAAMWSSLS